MAAKVKDSGKTAAQDSDTSKTATEQSEATITVGGKENVSELEPRRYEGGDNGNISSPGRRRKRHLYNAIRAQMEFYFGDANLSKDRFLRRHVEQDPFVPLDIFLNFNKIKTLTEDVQQIAMSLSNSHLLELDETKLKVRRRTALPTQRDVNDKTLYVEALPATATHDWLKEVFSRYGAVAYVSLPHYAGSRKIKEFAFVEFEKAASVEKAVKAFAQVHGVLSVDQTEPSELASVRNYHELKPKQPLKREADTKSMGLEAPPSAKRLKLEQSSEADTAESSTDNEHKDSKDIKDSKPRRKRKHKKLQLQDRQQPNIDPSALELKVLPKCSWCSLRNKYLNLQRRLVSEAKSKLWRSGQATQQPAQLKGTPNNHQQKQQQQQQEPLASTAQEQLENADVVEETPVPPKRRKRNKQAGVHKMNMNFYGAGGSETEDSKLGVKAEERQPLFKYEPGLIVECVLPEPCANVKEFKADLRQYTNIQYVDIKEGEQLAHLRLTTPTAAEELVRQLNCAERQLQVLHGQAETLYWRKIEQDREAKLSKKVRVQQKRGREKVAKLLAKHIKFDDAEDEALPMPAHASDVGGVSSSSHIGLAADC
ncbi:CG42569 [Drosophila busckii]|uniref:La-related protein 7 n=1 Tax=Drosophila busckii TaxID=30019 RepID=A0A0M4EU12_DROBS|nr:CG42569 [Drosophila busckii]